MALPVVVTFFAQVVIFDNKLPEFGVALQGLEQWDKALGWDVVCFDFEWFDSAMLL